MNLTVRIEDTYIDLYGDEIIKIVKQISDVRDIFSRNSSFTKQFKVPGTKINNLLFNHIFEINSDSTFNPNKKAKAYIYRNDILAIEGYAQLLKINHDLDSGEITYQLTIYGNNFNFINLIKGKDIANDIDWSDLNHQRNFTTVWNSWTANTSVVYPVVDYGFGLTKQGMMFGKVDVKNMFPFVRLKTVTDRIIQGAGYTYTSPFFESDYYKQKIISASGAESPIGTFSTKVRLTWIGPSQVNPLLDPFYQNYEIRIRRKPAGSNGWFTLASETGTLFSGSEEHSFSVDAYVGEGDQFGVAVYLDGQFTSSYSNIKIDSGATFSAEFNSLDVQQSFNAEKTTDTIYQYVTNGVYQIVFEDDFTAPNFDEANTFNTTTGIQTINPIPFKYWITKNSTQQEMFKDVCTLYHLYVDTDPDKESNLLIYPRDDYYASGRTLNWTSYLNTERPIEYTLLSELQAREFEFTWTEDNDHYNDYYATTTNRIYGDKRLEIDNDFLVGNKREIKTNFSPTVNYLIPGSSEFNIPAIFSLKNENNKLVPESTEFNLRILNYEWIDLKNEYWRIRENGTLQPFVFSGYPFAGMDSYYQEHSLSWEAPVVNYFATSGTTPNNLYNQFYRRYIEQIIDKDSKLLKAEFALPIAEFNNLRMNDKIYLQIKGEAAYFIINKIEYDVISEIAICELLKLNSNYKTIKTRARIPVVKGRALLSDLRGSGNNAGSFTTIIGDNNDVEVDSFYNTISGNNNIIGGASENNFILGNNNYLGYSSNTISIIGNNNYVNEDTLLAVSGDPLYNVFILGDNITASTSNTLYTHNISTTTLSADSIFVSGLSLSDFVYSGQSLGSGVSVFKEKVDNDLHFKSLQAGANISLSSSGDTITINSSGGTGSGITTGQTLSTSFPIYAGNSSSSVMDFKGLSGGTGLSLSNQSNIILLSPDLKKPKRDIGFSAGNRTCTATGGNLFFGIGTAVATNVEANTQWLMNYAFKTFRMVVYVSANSCNRDHSVVCRKNGSNVITIPITATSTGWFTSSTIVDFASSDLLSFAFIDSNQGGGSITLQSIILSYYEEIY